MSIKGLFEHIIRLVYPPACPLCGTVLSRKRRKNRICEDCEPKLIYVEPPVCLKCGKEIDDDEHELCVNCQKNPRSYVRGFPVFNYAGDIRKSLAGFKYHGKRVYAEFYADAIVKKHGDMLRLAGVQALVPVPVHKKKLKKRGYNQAEVLAAALGRRLSLPVESGLVVRTTNTLPQKELDDKEREKNLKKAFTSGDKIVKYKSVLLVDDIYTTGATIEACTRVLHGLGVEEVYYTSVCIGKGY